MLMPPVGSLRAEGYFFMERSHKHNYAKPVAGPSPEHPETPCYVPCSISLEPPSSSFWITTLSYMLLCPHPRFGAPALTEFLSHPAPLSPCSALQLLCLRWRCHLLP